MVDINWGILQNSLAQPNPGERFQMGFQQGQARAKERERDNALAQLGANPQDPKALAGLYRVDPRLGLQYGEMLHERQAAATKQQQEADERERKIFARAAKMAKDPAAWDSIVDQLTPHYPEVAAYRGKFDPNLRASLMALGGETDDEPNAPSSVQEYQFAKGQGFGGTYMDFLGTKQGPIVANNGDGTFQIIPRNMVGGGGAQTPAAQGGPQPGAIEDGYRFKGGNPADPNSWEPVEGGASPSNGSGGFR